MSLMRSSRGIQLRFQPDVVWRQSLHCRSHQRTPQTLTKSPNRILYTYSGLFNHSILPIMSSTIRFRSHSGHTHHHDTSYLTSTNKKDAGVRITRIGLYVNIGMAISKGVGGYLFHSQALMADAFHALTDMVSDVMTLITVSKANKLATSRYPNGYGKVESLGSLGVSGLLCAGGILMLNNSCGILYQQFFAEAALTIGHDHGHGLFNLFGLSHSHGSADIIPNINAAWLALGSIIVKEYLYRATIKIANERKSSILASNAVHHRVDSLTSIVALLAIGGSHIFNNATWLDPIGGLLVSLMVIRAGWSNTMAAGRELLDVSVDDEVKESLRKAAMTALRDGIGSLETSEISKVEVHDIQGIKAGQKYRMDLELAVPSTWSMKQIQEVERTVRERVGLRVRMLGKLRIRFVTIEGEKQDFTDEFIGSAASAAEVDVATEEEHEHDHEHEHLDHSKSRKLH